MLDMLAIGDTAIDTFIRLTDAHVTCSVNNETCEICMRWGDKIPYESATEVPGVGNAANAAVAGSRLGLRTSLRAYVGEDDLSGRVLERLAAEGVDTSLLVRQEGKHTNYHYVLWYGSERTILIKHERYDYGLPPATEAPKWVYLSSLGENSLPYHDAIAERLSQWPHTRLAFQPGTFQITFGSEALTRLYARTDIFFCNKEEAQRILGSSEEHPKQLLEMLRALGPKTAIITDGRAGAYAMDETAAAWYIPMYPDEREPFERTGAGDAFASSVVSALAMGIPIEKALLWGPINAAEVVQKIGAQEGLRTRKELEERLHAAPDTYALVPLA